MGAMHDHSQKKLPFWSDSAGQLLVSAEKKALRLNLLEMMHSQSFMGPQQGTACCQLLCSAEGMSVLTVVL